MSEMVTCADTTRGEARGAGRWRRPRALGERVRSLALAGALVASVGCQGVTGLDDLSFDGPEVGGGGSDGGVGGSTGGGAGQGGGPGGSAGAGGKAGAGAGGASGTSGQGGAGASGAPVCPPGNGAPVAGVVSTTIEALAGDVVTLDGSKSSDPDGGGLIFAWEPLGGAPAVASPDHATTTVTVSDCGTFVYRLTVTDGCGATASTEVTVQAPSGGYVRGGAQCDAAVACGSQQRPWCQVQAGIAGTTGTVTLRVASGTYSAVTLRDGVTVEGGYASDFVTRDGNAATNGTVITGLQQPAVQGAPAGSATLDGVTLMVAATSAVAVLSAVEMQGTGALTLHGVTAPGGTQATQATRTCGVRRGPGVSGSLVIEAGSELVGANAASRSAGLCLEGPGVVGLDQMTARGGGADDSAGIDASFDGKLVVSGSTIAGGDATTRSSGLRFVTTSLTPGASVSLAETTVQGGRGGQTYGVEAQRIGQVAIKGGEVRGEAAPGSGSTAATRGVGVWASQVGTTTGSDPAVTLDGVTIEGATSASERVGVLVDTSGLRLTGGMVDGSTQAGGRRAVGVRVEGTTAVASGVTIEKTARVGGGAPAADLVTIEAYGVELAAPTPASIHDNTLLVGCASPCAASVAGSLAAGVRVQQGKPVISKNKLVVGGPQQGTGAARHLGIWGQKCQGQTCVATEPTVTGNTLVAGNTDPARRPAEATGMALDGVRGVVTDNARVQGGYAVTLAAGLDATEGKGSSIRRNALAGGAAQQTYGLRSARQTSLLVDANTVDACGLLQDGNKADAICQQTVQAVGLQSVDDDGAQLSNNLAFGGYGYGSTGCVVGNGFTGSQTGALLAYSLCLGVGRAKKTGESTTTAAGLRLVGSQSQKPRGLTVLDNLLLTASRSFERYVVVDDGATQLTLTNNDLWILGSLDLGPGLALYLRTATEYDTISTLQGTAAPNIVSANVSSQPAFSALDVDALSATSLFASGTCVLGGQGVAVGPVTTDFNGVARKQPPSIGPVECP